MDKEYYLHHHIWCWSYEMPYIQEAFDTNWIAPLGANVNGFENELAQMWILEHAAALSAGTAAIHLALKALGVGARRCCFLSITYFLSNCKSNHLSKCHSCFYR